MKGPWTIIAAYKVSSIFAKVTVISILHWFVWRWDGFLIFLTAFLFFRSRQRFIVILTRFGILLLFLVGIVILTSEEGTQVWWSYLILSLFIFFFSIFCFHIINLICLISFIFDWRYWWSLIITMLLFEFILAYHLNIWFLVILHV